MPTSVPTDPADPSLTTPRTSTRARDQGDFIGPPTAWFALVLVLATVVFCGWLGSTPVVTSHEARVAGTARTMADAGWPWAVAPVRVALPEIKGGRVADAGGETVNVNPWLVPLFEGKVRLQKPPLPYWTTATLYRLFGASEFMSRVAPAALGAMSIVALYGLARRASGRRVATVAIFVWIGTFFVVSEYRKSMADPYLAATVLGAIWAWVAGCDRSASRARRNWATFGFYIAMGLGALAKGPVVFLHVTVAVTAYGVCMRRWPRGNVVVHLVGVLAFLAIALPWPMYVATHVPGAVDLWRYESVGEFADNMRNAKPFWVYVPALLSLSFPWTLWWAAGIWIAVRRGRRQNRRAWFAVLWVVVVVAIFSLANVKKNAYLLPLMPAMTVLAAKGIVVVPRLLRRSGRGGLLRRVAGAHTLCGLAVGLFVAGATAYGWWKGAETGFPAGPILVMLFAVAVGIAPAFVETPRLFARWAVVQAASFGLLFMLLLSGPMAERKSRRAPLIDFNQPASANAPAQTNVVDSE